MQEITATDNDFVILRRYIVIVLRHWWLLLLAVALASAAAYVLSKRQPPVYQATTSLIVGHTIQSTNLTSRDIQISQQLALVYADMAGRQPVLQAVVDTLGLNMTWRALKPQVSVHVKEDINLLEITAEGPSPEAAQAVANELARQLILLSPTALENQEPDSNKSFVRERLETLRTRIRDGQVKLEELEAAVLLAESATDVRMLQDEINLLEGFISDWESNYAQLLALTNWDESANYLAVIEPAQATPGPVKPNLRLNILGAAILGIAFALGIIFVLEYLDDTLKTAEDVTSELNMTPLGSVAHIRGKNYQEKLITRHDPFSQISESYRIIRSNIQFVSVDGAYKTIMVTSARPGEGKSTLAANLAIAMAQAGYKTIIVDADLRQPTQHKIFQTSGRHGLTDLLRSSDSAIEAYMIDTAVPGLRLLASGELPPNPSELLGSQRMGQLIDHLTQIADIIIFDSTPAISVADAAVLSNRVDGVVMLVEAGRTHRTLVKQASLSLARAGATVLGAVLNRASSRDGRYPVWRNQPVFSLALRTFWQWLRRWPSLPFIK